MLHRVLSYFGLAGEEEAYDTETEVMKENSQDWFEEDEMLASSAKKRKSEKVVSFQSARKQSKLILIQPRSYSEAQEIANYLINRAAVAINLERIDHAQAKRIIDFVGGTVYAIGGEIQKIGQHIFICTPQNVEIDGYIPDWEQGEA